MNSHFRQSFFFLFCLLLALPVVGALLSFIQVFRDGLGADGLGGPVAVAASPGGEQIYVIGQDDDSLAVFSRSPFLGTLTFVEQHQNNVDGVFGLLATSGVTVSPDGRHVYVTSEVDDTLAVFSRAATNDFLTFVADQLKQDTVGGVFGLDGASSVAASPEGEQIFVTGRVDEDRRPVSAVTPTPLGWPVATGHR